MDDTVRIWGVIPAAGMGRRMGGPKQVMPYRNSTLVGTVARTLLDAGIDGLVIVTRTALVDALGVGDDNRIHIAINDDESSEMIDSIRIGLGCLARADTEGNLAGNGDGVIVVPGDMPRLSVEACRRCMEAFRFAPDRIVIGANQGRRGHPIVFPFAMRGIIDALTGGLKGLAARFPDRVHIQETHDPGSTQDVDTPEDYDQLR